MDYAGASGNLSPTSSPSLLARLRASAEIGDTSLPGPCLSRDRQEENGDVVNTSNEGCTSHGKDTMTTIMFHAHWH
jgi:hypothetical protein